MNCLMNQNRYSFLIEELTEVSLHFRLAKLAYSNSHKNLAKNNMLGQ